MSKFPSLQQIDNAAERLKPFLIQTPTLPYYGTAGLNRLADNTDVWLKMELFQHTGSFKARGAINTIMHLDESARATGITAFSAGNHAIATAYAARALGVSAKVAMPKSANPYRVEQCRNLGAEIVFGDNIGHLLELVENLQKEEGRTLVHPFEGDRIIEGTATVGRELMRDQPALDAVIVPVGGGGLIGGIAAAVKQTNPDCKVYGVEPVGAQGMTRSLAQCSPLATVDVNTIADSLGAPMHMPESFAIVQQFVDDVVTVTDAQLAEVMQLFFTDLKLAIEPACAAAMAGLLYPLADRLAGKRVGLILCGSNIDLATYNRIIQ